jgi:hypothetical protein
LLTQADDAGMSRRVNRDREQGRATGLPSVDDHMDTATRDPALGALAETNTDGPLAGMSRNRQGDLDALASSRLRAAPAARTVRLIA